MKELRLWILIPVLAMATGIADPALGQFFGGSFSRSLGGSLSGSGGSSTASVNASLEASANASVLASMASRLSQGEAWSEVALELSGPGSRASAQAVLAFTRAGLSTKVESVTRLSIKDIRSSLGLGPLATSPLCTPKTKVELPTELWQKALDLHGREKAALKAWIKTHFSDSALDPILGTLPVGTAPTLAMIERIAAEKKNSAVLSELSRRLFRCERPSRETALRGAAALVYLVTKASEADTGDSADRKSESRLHAIRERRKNIWQQERWALAGDPPPAPSEKPHLCLAMSGGGIRSAAFQLGVLQGLQELKSLQGPATITLLDELDVASAVSGGSYALAWLLSQDSLESELSDRKLAAKDGVHSWLTTYFEGAFGGLGAMVTQPLRLLSRLERTSIPDPTLGHLFYARLLKASFWIHDRPLSDLESNLTEQIFPIIGTTARLGEQGPCENRDSRPSNPFLGEAARLKQSVFELTPLAGGSGGFGFSSRLPEDLSLPMAVATAGAALDNPYTDYCGLLRGLGVTLGTRVGVWKPNLLDRRISSSISSSGPSMALPTPLSPLYLSDGGFADNLGVYPLLRRSCAQIVIADASYDPYLTFEDYQRLKRGLQAEGITLRSESLETLAQKQGVECGTSSKSSCLFEPSKAALQAPPAGRNADKTVFEGEIELPEGAEPRKIPFRYLKLAVEKDLAPYPAPVQKAYRSQPPGVQSADAFPHLPTSRQKLSKGDFRALRLLGCHLVQKAFTPQFSVPDGSPCRQKP